MSQSDAKLSLLLMRYRRVALSAHQRPLPRLHNVLSAQGSVEHATWFQRPRGRGTGPDALRRVVNQLESDAR